jgi:hypothetical protein
MTGIGGRRGGKDKKGKRNPKDNHPTHIGGPFKTLKCNSKHIFTIYKVPMPFFVKFNGAERVFYQGSLSVDQWRSVNDRFQGLTSRSLKCGD